MASDEPEDYSKLALDAKLNHKVWRARVMGYEEATKLFRKIDDESSSEYSKFTGLIKKFVIDSNQVAQEKGVEAALAFAECASAAKKIAKDVVGGVVTKCLGARAKTKESSIQVCLMFVEIEEQEAVLEALLEGFTNKQPKIVAGSVLVINRIAQEFGARVMNIKVLMGKVPSLFEHSDKNVRAEAKSLAIELYKWIGAAIKPALEKKLKPVQLKELEEEWGKLSGAPGAPPRLLRSQQAQPPAVASGGGADGGGGGGGGEERSSEGVAAAPVAIDPYDLADPEELLGKMPKDFFEKVADPKWKERKEALEAVLPLAQAMKLQPGDYGELVKALKKVITKDSNVLVVALAGNIVTGLAKGLRANFRPYSSSILAGIFEKFKEKKQNVVTSLREASDTVFLTTALSNIQEEVVESLGSKNPSVKAETLLFLCRCFQQCVPAMVPKPMLKALCPPILQKLDDTNQAVRDAAMECVGTLLRVVGDRPLNSYLENVDKTKLTKIQEHREAVELKIQTGVIPSPMKGQAARPPTPSAPSTASTSSEPAAKSEPPKKKKPPGPAGAKKKLPPTESGSDAGKAPSAASKESTSSAPPKKKAPPSSTAKVGGASGGGAKGKGKQKGGGKAGGDAPDPPEPNIANEEVEEKAGAYLPGGLLEQLADTKWKERLEACEKFKSFVEGQSPEEMQSLLCCKVLARKPGWKDSNFQVMNAKFAVVGVLVQKAKVFGRKSMASVMTALVEKLGDIKIKVTSGETLKVMAERMTLNYVAQQAMKLSFEQKSPKVHSESLEWLSQAIKEFGFLLEIKPFIDYIKKALAATNPAVRTAAVSLLGIIYLYIGAQLRMFFEDEKPALLQQIDAAFEKVSGESAPAPTRGPSMGGDEEEEAVVEGGADGGGGSGTASAKPVSMADLMPKVDISGQIKAELIKEMGDKNWKIRAESLQKVVDILKAAKFIEPNLGELPAGLKGRLGDSNKNLVITTLNIVSSLASSMGSNCSRHVKTLLPAVIGTFGDSKPQVRAAGLACLNAWHTEVGMATIVEQDIFTTSLTMENPNLRAELLHWLEDTLPSTGKLPSEFSTIVPPLFSCLEDRSGEVRKKAQAALSPIMAHVGYDCMSRQCSKLSPASKQAIKPLLDKAKPAKAPPPAAAAAAPQKTTAVASAASSSTASSKPAQPVAEDTPSPTKVKETPEPDKEEKKDKPGAEKKAVRGKKGPAKGGAKSRVGSKKGGAGEEESGALFVSVKNGKEARMKDEEKMKTLKWNFSQPRREHVEQLKDQMQPCVSAAIHAQLFHDDFKKHITALDTLTKGVKAAEGVSVAAIVGTTDLLLRWVSLRFFDTNTSVNLKCLEFLKVLFQLLIAQENYRMTDYEANGFLPYLVNKVGDAKDPVRKGVRALFRNVCSVFPPVKLFTFVLEGLKSKNARQRTECLEELGILIQNNGMIVCGAQPQKTVPLLAGQISDRDNTVRSAALNTMVVVYSNMGEGVYKFTSQLSDKDVSLLEERIRRSGKKFPSSSAVSQPSSVKPTETADPKKQGGLRLKPAESVAVKPVETTGETVPETTEPPTPIEEPPAPPEPVPQAPEPPKPGTVPGPFKLNVDFNKMWASVQARDDGGRGSKYRVELNREELQMLDQEPVEMPQLISKHLEQSYPVDLSPARMATTASAINFIISQLGSADYHTCCKAAKQLEGTILNSSQRAAINPNVDQLVNTLLMQMRMTFTTPFTSAGEKTLMQEVGKRLTSCIYCMFGEPSLVVLVTRDRLLEVEKDVMGYLSDEHVLRLSDGTYLIRTLNSLMQRLCENAEVNALYGSMIQLLLKSLSSEGCITPVSELTMKCLWKLTKQIPQVLPKLDIKRLLLDIHLFLQTYLETYQTPNHDDTAFRTVKTILFHVTKTMGAEILEHLTLIQNPAESKVLVYINRTLTKLNISTGALPKSRSSGSSAAPSAVVSGNEADKMRMKVQTMTRMLGKIPPGSNKQFSELFAQLSDPATTKEGFQALASYLAEHPSFNLDALLANQTTFYRNYIKQGLQAVRRDASEHDQPKSEYDMQYQILQDMKQKAGPMFGVSKQELLSGVDHSKKVDTTDENKPVNTARPGPAKSSLPRSSSLRAPTTTGKAAGAGTSSSVNLADLRKRLNQLMSTN